MKHKQLIVAGVVTSAIAGSLLAWGSAYASPNSSAGFAERFAQRFNLNTTEVQNFMDEERETHRKDMEQARDERLQTLVDNGTLTVEQRDALIEKMNAMHAERDAMREEGVSKTDMHERMDELRSELQSWADAQGINLDDVRPAGGHGPKGKAMHRHAAE